MKPGGTAGNQPVALPSTRLNCSFPEFDRYRVKPALRRRAEVPPRGELGCERHEDRSLANEYNARPLRDRVYAC
jgi:hypothetical protein